ncbi:hypothetical protein G3601_005101 [Salmonella enterica]|nr:hypothetical protein [Salmonella enterica subsp. enterica serovar 4,[5],12:b:-]EDQ8094367.1 hypothetical protein [Salmonella enterica subsp. enterica serovar Java]EDR2261424.1 hypothetical protein [Salmonella enterica]EDV9614011.1 hypothetical protein [Salmonella enterica subsp. enterica serovar Paratyphi B]EEE5613239.1 hypothetical protein [Salmonella enterica subsp. enterica serovar Typhimurium]
MSKMNVAISADLLQTLYIKTKRPIIDIRGSDFTDVSAVILSLSDISNG